MTNDGRPKRWVVVRPPGARTGAAAGSGRRRRPARAVGGQHAGRVGSSSGSTTSRPSMADVGGRRRVRLRPARRAVRAGRGVPRRGRQPLGPCRSAGLGTDDAATCQSAAARPLLRTRPIGLPMSWTVACFCGTVFDAPCRPLPDLQRPRAGGHARRACDWVVNAPSPTPSRNWCARAYASPPQNRARTARRSPRRPGTAGGAPGRLRG